MEEELLDEVVIAFIPKRSKRRHNNERLKKKRINYHGGYAKKALKEGDINYAKHCTGIWHNTPAVCSCWMCGNPRKYMKNKLTIQEQKAPTIKDF